MKTTIQPFITLLDEEYMDNFSIGYHRHQPLLDVKEIRIGYPVTDWAAGDINIYPMNFKGVTLSKVMHAIRDIILKEYTDGNNYAPHVPADYCIEIIDIENGIATITIGS